MKNRSLLSPSGCLLVSLLLSDLHAQANLTSPRQIPEQMQPDVSEKRMRTVPQQKIDSQLLMAARLKRQGLATTTKTDVVLDSAGRATVDISAEVTDRLLATIRREGGEVINSYPQFRAVRAYLTLESLETIAGLSEVRVISRAAAAELSGAKATKEVPRQSPKPPGKVQQYRNATDKQSGIKSRRKRRRRQHVGQD